MTMNDFKQRFEPKPTITLTADPQVVVARFSACGKILAAGGYDGTVRRWDIAADPPAELSVVRGHHGWVQGLAFHPQEPLAYSADSWGRLQAWRYTEPDPQPVFHHAAAHDGWIRDLAVSPDGSLLASCGRDQAVRLWSPRDGAFQRELPRHPHDVYCLRFHPSWKFLVSGDDRGGIRQWDLATGECVREFDARVLYSLSRLQDVGGVKVLGFNRDGTILACGGTTPKNGGTVTGIPTVLLFDFSSGELKTTIKYGSENDCFVHDLYLHDAGFVMAVTCGTPGQGKLWFQRPEDAEPFFVTTKMANTQCLSVHPDGRRLAVLATNPGSNGNGRQLKDGAYLGNQSPIHFWSLPEG